MTVPLKYAVKVPANSAHRPAPFSSEKRTGILHTLVRKDIRVYLKGRGGGG